MSITKARALMRLMSKSRLSTLELRQEGFSLTLRRIPIGVASEAAALAAADPRQPMQQSPATVIASPEAGRVRLAHPLRSRKAAAGQSVSAGEPILFIDRDGRLFAVESRTAGRIARLLVREGQRVDSGAPLMLLDVNRE